MSSWWPSLPSLPRWRWIPTSSQKLEEAEKQMLAPVRAPMERMTVKVGEHSINTIKTGSGPPLVLVHGFGAGIGFWCGNIDALSKRYTVYAMDMVGFGRSSRPKTSFKTPEQAEDFFTGCIEGWAQSVGLQKFVLLGHSLGGYVSALYALKHSDRVAHLILADPWGVPKKPLVTSTELTISQQLIRAVFTAGSPLSALRIVGPYGPSLIARVRPDIPAKFEHVHTNTQVVLDYLYHSNAQTPPTGELAFSKLTEGFGWARNPLINMDALPAEVPTTFIYGEHTWMDTDAGRELSEKMKGPVSLLQVPGGHHLYIDSAADFNKAVLRIAGHLGDLTYERVEPVHHHDVQLEMAEGGVTEKILTE